MLKHILLTPLLAFSLLLQSCGGGSDYQENSTSLIAPANDREIVLSDAAMHAVLVTGETVDAQPWSIEQSEVQAPDMATNPLYWSEEPTIAEAAASVSVHTPQQIRAAYQMPALPGSFEALDAAQRALFGAGQTIYVVTAYQAPNLMEDLQTFASQFNLPGCELLEIPLAVVELAPHDPADGCKIAVVNLKVGMRRVGTAPSYVRSWAVEQTLDVQWAHATAPLARIVVIRTVNSFVNSLMSAMHVAERFGPGVVSMSFVASEGRWSVDYETIMPNGQGLLLVAASGDRGAQSNWPASSPSVLAVGGSTLRYDVNSQTATESLWSRSGGAFSAVFPRPPYQEQLDVGVSGFTTKLARQPGLPARATGDVSFNADPLTGQYVAFTEPGKTLRWYSYGGTSIGVPQWAGILAVANSIRRLDGKSLLSDIHTPLYGGALVTGLNDIREGTNGSCAVCAAGDGYDIPSGWGSPVASRLLPLLAELDDNAE